MKFIHAITALAIAANSLAACAANLPTNADVERAVKQYEASRLTHIGGMKLHGVKITSLQCQAYKDPLSDAPFASCAYSYELETQVSDQERRKNLIKRSADFMKTQGQWKFAR